MISVSRETSEKLNQFEQLIIKWNKAINLVSPHTENEVRVRHIEDCLQIAEMTTSPAGTWVDLGSGGGLPGIVLSIVLASEDVEFKLVDSDQRKVAFLRAAVRELELVNVQAICGRIEFIAPLNADHVSARALAPLPQLVPLVHRHLNVAGTAWLMKGKNWRAEVDQAKRDWQFDTAAFPSRTDPEAAVLKLTGVAHA